MKPAHVIGLSEQLQPNGWGRTGSCSLSPMWMGAREAEGSGLLSRRSRKRLVGSNPTPSVALTIEPAVKPGSSGGANQASSGALSRASRPGPLGPTRRGARRHRCPITSTSRPGRVERGRRVRVRVSVERKTRVPRKLTKGKGSSGC